jgi:hypothetical protein
VDQSPVIDPSAMPHLRVEATEAAGVWHVRLPTWPWQYGRAEEEREALVRRLTDRAPIRRLWLSDSTDDSHGQWLVLATDQALGDVGSGLEYGDWLLLFFERDPDPGALGLAPVQPKSPAAAVERLTAYGASAAIWSWLDDAEWLVAHRT